MIIWRIFDGKPGHDHQSRGLIKAIAKYVPVDCHDLCASNQIIGSFNYLFKKFPAGKNLPKPDLIIGAGHGTHLDVMSAQHAYGGKTVILMKPSLPTSFFDFCLIPEHDKPVNSDRIIATYGAINTVIPSEQHDSKLGVILIGGPSKHFDWDLAEIINQIETISGKTDGISWQLTDSPRTPDSTREALRHIKTENITFNSFKETPTGWLDQQLQKCGQSWVSADSISMIYESLTSGTATGILHVPEKRSSKIGRSIDTLNNDHMVTLFEDWCSGKTLLPPPVSLNEADRCAKELIKKLS